jgi:hypothetical protein
MVFGDWSVGGGLGGGGYCASVTLKVYFTLHTEQVGPTLDHPLRYGG